MASRWVHSCEDGERQQARSSFCEVNTATPTPHSESKWWMTFFKWWSWKWFLGATDSLAPMSSEFGLGVGVVMCLTLGHSCLFLLQLWLDCCTLYLTSASLLLLLLVIIAVRYVPKFCLCLPFFTWVDHHRLQVTLEILIKLIAGGCGRTQWHWSR